MRTSHIIHVIFILARLASAWSAELGYGAPAEVQVENALRRRQDNTSAATDASITSPSTTTTETSTPSSTTSTASTTSTSSIIPTTTTTTTQVSINSTDPTGGISMLTPAATLGSQFYRVGTPVTLVWNYTSLQRTPTAIDVLATFTPSGGGIPASPFTLALNASFEATQTFTWDTGAYALQTPLPVGTYTLIVYDADAEGGATATARPGYLGTQEQFYFGVYTPQPYTPLADGYVCATCNAAGGKMERLTWSVLGGSLMVSLASFVWFAGGWGVLF